MSEENREAASAQEQAEAKDAVQPSDDSRTVKLPGLYAFKLGMSTVYDEKGEAVPVTVLKYEPWVVSQLKAKGKEGYNAVQIACQPKSKKNSIKSESGHLKTAGFENGAHFVRELPVASTDSYPVGSQVSIHSLEKGDSVSLSSRSKGRGFAGVVKRYGFAGGPAAHGSGFHRRPGSIGCREFPGRVMPGQKLPGHMGDRNVTVRNLKVVDVLPEEGVVLVRGSVPGARNSLVRLMKQ